MSELPSAGKHSSGSGSHDLYKIEVRSIYPTPTAVPLKDGKVFVIDGTWREVGIEHGDYGVASGYSERVARAHHLSLVSYNAAQSHRYAFLASLDASNLGSYCLETRLVKIRLSYTFECVELGVSEAQDFHHER